MVTLFVVVAYLYIRRPGPATGALLVLGSGLLSSDLAIEIGVSAVDARGGLVLWLYVFNTQVVYVMGWARLLAFVVLFPAHGRRCCPTAGSCRRCAPPRWRW